MSHIQKLLGSLVPTVEKSNVPTFGLVVFFNDCLKQDTGGKIIINDFDAKVRRYKLFQTSEEILSSF